tara:strand:- start:6105 stop:6902 length:798 start_codon:yes stop_codon:yes gene_type:complete
MIDFHNHILPNLDDGSKSTDMSIKMLSHAEEQGITDVVNTVHYLHPKVDGIDLSYDRIKDETKKLQSILDEASIKIKLHIGSEVFYKPNLIEYKNDPVATIGKGKYMLLEFSPNFIPNSHKQTFFDLKMNGITPIIAHPERYKPVQKNINIVYDWLNAGCIIQVDAGSVLGYLGNEAQIASEKIIKQKWCQILGSDAHDLNKRNFNLDNALSIVIKWIGEHYATLLVTDYPKAIINGDSLLFDFEEIKLKNSISILDRFYNFRKK